MKKVKKKDHFQEFSKLILFLFAVNYFVGGAFLLWVVQYQITHAAAPEYVSAAEFVTYFTTPIVAATPNVKTFHQLALSWGVYPVLARNQDDFDSLFRHAIDCAKQIDLVSDGDRVVIVGGIPLDTPGNTNIIKVETVNSGY